MENGPFEDVFPIKNADTPLLGVSGVSGFKQRNIPPKFNIAPEK